MGICANRHQWTICWEMGSAARRGLGSTAWAVAGWGSSSTQAWQDLSSVGSSGYNRSGWELKLIQKCCMIDDWIITLLGGGYDCWKCSLIAYCGWLPNGEAPMLANRDPEIADHASESPARGVHSWHWSVFLEEISRKKEKSSIL